MFEGSLMEEAINEKSILIIEKEMYLRKYISYFLDHFDIGIYTAKDIDSASKILEKIDIKLILVNIEEAHEDELFDIKRLKELFPNLKVIITTPQTMYLDEKLIEKSLHMSKYDVFHKEVDFIKFIQRIKLNLYK